MSSVAGHRLLPCQVSQICVGVAFVVRLVEGRVVCALGSIALGKGIGGVLHLNPDFIGCLLGGIVILWRVMVHLAFGHICWGCDQNLVGFCF